MIDQKDKTPISAMDNLLADLIHAVRPVIALPNAQPNLVISDQLIDFANKRHRMGSIFGQVITADSQIGLDITDSAAANAAALHKQNVLRELQQKSVSKKLSQLFNRHKIPMWFLKGQGICDALYPFAGGRWSKDIDMLIRPQDVDRALQAMQSEGFCAGQTGDAFISDIRHFRKGLSKDALLYDPQFALQIELHRRLLYAEPRGFTDHIVEGAETGCFISPLSAQGMFYIIMHGAVDYWSRLKWLIDLSLLARKIDRQRMDVLLDMAHRFSCRSALIASLQQCENIFVGSLDKDMAQYVAVLAQKDKAVQPLIDRFNVMLHASHDYKDRKLWSRPDFPSPAWHIFPSLSMRAWLCGYVPATYIARKFFS